jgi:hypothetical protein
MSTSDAHANVTLTVQAQAWLARLPAPVRAHGTAMYAPEIANRLAATWDDLDSVPEILEGLLVAGEQALPHEVTAELLRLYEYHARCRAAEAASTTWELPASGLPGFRRV